ncbi:HET domain protein [Talaromyces stipitatus ATCC 10500]|uniref:HET domain protein n=1 Tax=Talaromyces stipitatus (strain ATCC 10500 / CBS 375.48 / QM 6759 / NRRL 1006) TaxID=441959 RepID=B8MCC2_TALSN|nr:HET domain protein [Talaromyces stipitatus ATCC 10500]EED18568.1 HET domain protein [Talaromyces stipitatus ATCC 10500]
MDLRYEAMGQINNNFLNSKVTLLVDRDLMEIDIDRPSLEAKEAIVATLVVCDWNVRAWTLLEGMRGCWNLHILCKDNHIISLGDTLNDVLAYSNLTLIPPCLALQHYVPTDDRPVEGEIPPAKIEQATCLLNHRHATKDRDVTLIWSLVCGSKLCKASVDFWKSTVGNFLSTGFLVFSSPRLQGEYGFSWAPSHPNLLPPTAGTPSTEQYPAYDGEDSVAGRVTEQGFKAQWLACLIGRSRALPTWLRLKFFEQDESEVPSYIYIYNKEAYTVIAPVFKKYLWVSLLLPAVRDRGASGAASPPRPFQYQGEAKGPLLVIAGSNDGNEWEWQFVHEWDTSFQLPEFVLKDLLFV